MIGRIFVEKNKFHLERKNSLLSLFLGTLSKLEHGIYSVFHQTTFQSKMPSLWRKQEDGLSPSILKAKLINGSETWKKKTNLTLSNFQMKNTKEFLKQPFSLENPSFSKMLEKSSTQQSNLCCKSKSSRKDHLTTFVLESQSSNMHSISNFTSLQNWEIHTTCLKSLQRSHSLTSWSLTKDWLISSKQSSWLKKSPTWRPKNRHWLKKVLKTRESSKKLKMKF